MQAKFKVTSVTEVNNIESVTLAPANGDEVGIVSGKISLNLVGEAKGVFKKNAVVTLAIEGMEAVGTETQGTETQA